MKLIKDLKMSQATRGWIVVFLTLLVAIAGCSRSPEAHLDRGDKHFAREQYREAIIEYRNVLRYDPANVQAIRQLGFAHYALGELAPAFGYLQRSKELDPTNLDVRQKLATLYLIGGRLAEAQQEAAFILDKEPKTLEALALSAGAARTPQEIAAAISRLEAGRPDFADRAQLYLALGTLYLRKQNLVEAEKAFREAVAKEPNSVDAHSALGNFFEGK